MSSVSAFTTSSPVPSSLYRRWWFVVLLSGGLVALGGAGLHDRWGPAEALRWSLLSASTLAFVLGYARRFLANNRRSVADGVLPRLGAGNTLTLARGVLTALLAGFLLFARPPGALAWAPALLYLGVGVLDFLDGYVARRYDGVTLLGAKLDLTYDALGTFVAVGVAVGYGQLPAAYLVLGGAYYLFSGHMALRRRRGRPVHPLPPSGHRRFFSGCLFGFLAVVLAPVFSPPGTVMAGALFGLPIAAGFLRDWLVAVGLVDAASDGYRQWRERTRALVFVRLPVGLRAAVVVLGVLLLARGAWAGGDWAVRLAAQGVGQAAVHWLAATATASLASVGLGWMGRVGSLWLLAVACADLLLRGFDGLNASVIAGSIAILLLGTGAVSLWRPEDHVLLNAVGSPRSTRTAS